MVMVSGVETFRACGPTKRNAGRSVARQAGLASKRKKSKPARLVNGRQVIREKKRKACGAQPASLSHLFLLPRVESRASRRQDSQECPRLPFLPSILSEPDFSSRRPTSRKLCCSFPYLLNAFSTRHGRPTYTTCQYFFYEKMKIFFNLQNFE